MWITITSKGRQSTSDKQILKELLISFEYIPLTCRLDPVLPFYKVQKFWLFSCFACFCLFVFSCAEVDWYHEMHWLDNCPLLMWSVTYMVDRCICLITTDNLIWFLIGYAIKSSFCLANNDTAKKMLHPKNFTINIVYTHLFSWFRANLGHQMPQWIWAVLCQHWYLKTTSRQPNGKSWILIIANGISIVIHRTLWFTLPGAGFRFGGAVVNVIP